MGSENGTYKDTLLDLEERRERILSGGINCIPSPFKRFSNDFCGIEQDTYYCITSYTKGGKCFGAGTLIRMADNSLKKVEDIKPGDMVMSPGTAPAKEVLGTTHGVAPLYQITSEMHDSFVVNDEHIMYLYDYYQKKYVTMPMKKLYEEYKRMRWNYFSRKYKIVASEAVSIDSTASTLPIEPYFYGLWLGDDDTKDSYITTSNKEIVDYIQDYANRLGLTMTSYAGTRSCAKYRISRKTRNGEAFTNILKSVCNWSKDNINPAYLNASIEDRYALLAGILDTDGYLNPNKSGYRICLKQSSLIDDVISLARSLGFSCSKAAKYNKKYGKYYYYAMISGDNCQDIPCRVKKVTHATKVNRRLYPFKIREIGAGNYYGFEVGGDHLFLLKDYTVVHNSQATSYMFIYKTLMYAYFAKEDLDFKIIYFPLEETKERILQRFMSWLLFTLSHGKIRVSPKELRSTTSAIDQSILDRLAQDDIQGLLQYFEEHVIFPTEAPNPTGIYKYCKQYAEEHGTVYKKTIKIKDEFGVPQDTEVFDHYEQDNPKEYRMIIIDTINLIDTERGMTLKQSMDKLSEYLAKYLRNRYHYSPIVIQQQAFESEGNKAFELGRVRPSVYGLGDSKYVSRDANVVLGLFAPFRFGITEYFGYDVTQLKDHLRFLEVIANRDGEMGGLLPLWFDGAVCDFKELPKPDDKAGMAKVYNICNSLASTGQYPVAKSITTKPALFVTARKNIKHFININFKK